MPWEIPSAIYSGTMLIFWEIPIAATASEPNTEVKLFSTVMLVTFSRFWMEEGMPTPQMPATRQALPWPSPDGGRHRYSGA